MTNIEWTHVTWNPVTGCEKVSNGCLNCYAEPIAHLFWGDRPFTEVRCHPERLNAPLHWEKPRRVFVNSMSDLFHEDVPDEFIREVLWVVQRTPRHQYQVLTKRPLRMRQFFADHPDAPILPQLWLGVSCEDQKTADERIPILLQTPAAVRFVSCEPLLSPIHLGLRPLALVSDRQRIDWVIVGGESGPQARPCDVVWIRSIVQQCQAATIPVFVKQLGAHPCEEDTNSKIILSDRKGGDPSEWPADLRIREWPCREARP